MLPAAAPTTIHFPYNSSINVIIFQYFAVLSSDSVGGCYSTWRRQVWSLTRLALESLRLVLGRDWTSSVIFRTLSPICILFVVGYYFVSSAVIWIFLLYKVYSWFGRVVLYIYLVVVAEYLWSVVMLPASWQPGIAYYADLGGNVEIHIVPDPGESQGYSHRERWLHTR